MRLIHILVLLAILATGFAASAEQPPLLDLTLDEAAQLLDREEAARAEAAAKAAPAPPVTWDSLVARGAGLAQQAPERLPRLVNEAIDDGKQAATDAAKAATDAVNTASVKVTDTAAATEAAAKQALDNAQAGAAKVADNAANAANAGAGTVNDAANDAAKAAAAAVE